MGVNTEIVSEGINGYVCEAVTDANPDNYPSWEKALVLLLSNAELRQSLGIQGRIRITESYSLEAFKKEYLEVLRKDS